MQSNLDEVTLRHLASNLGKEWKTLATHLRVRRDEVDRIQANNRTAEEQIFQMLMTWWQRWDNHEIEGFGELDAICDALVKTGRTDLAESLKDPVEGTKDFNFDVCRAEFIRYYKDAMGMVPLLPWLPSDVSKIEDIYVQLKLMEKQNMAARVVQHDIGSYEDILSLELHNNQPLRYILLSGIAGSGKTTIVSKIANDWTLERPESPLSKFRLLVALSIRELKSTSDLIEAIFDQILPKDTKVSRVSLRNYLTSHANEILVMLDGADEFDKEGSQLPVEGDVIDIISNKILRGCTVIVTTRPHMVDKLCKLNPCFTHIVSNGFSDSGVEEYIQKFFKDENVEISTELCRYLGESESLHNLARTPMMLLLMCLLWSEEHKLAKTLTELFKDTLFFMLRRYFEKCGQFSDNDDTFLSHYLMDLVQELGKTALDGLLLPGQKLVFEAGEFRNSKMVEKAVKIGLLSQEGVRSKLRIVRHVTFFHKTFQEAIAGFYWASLAESDEDSFNQYLHRVNDKNAISLEYLLRFSCGANVRAARSLLTHIISCFTWEGLGRFYNNGCWYLHVPIPRMGDLCLLMHLEAQSNELHTTTIPMFKNGIFFDLKWGEDIRMAFEFLVACASQPSVSQSFQTELKEVTILSVNKHEPLVIDILRHAKNVTNILLEFNPATNDKQVEAGFQDALGDVLSRLPVLVNLSLFGRLMPGKPINLSVIFKRLARSCIANSLQRLVLQRVVVDPSYLKTFVEKQVNLQHLSLVGKDEQVCSDSADNGDDGDDDANSIGPQMQSLQELNVRYYKTPFLTNCLGWSCPNLQVLQLFEDDLQEEAFQKVSILVSRAPKLQVVDLSGNKIGVAFPKLAKQLQTLQNLEVLILKHVGLISDHVMLLGKSVLPLLAKLRILSISNNDSISPQALLAVLQWACTSTSIQELSLQGCTVMEPDAETPDSTEDDSQDLLKAEPTQRTHQSSLETLTISRNVLGTYTSQMIRLLKEMPSLQTIDLSCMGLTDSDVVYLVEALSECQQLQELYLYRDDNLGDVGMEALLKMLPKLPYLRHLELPVNIEERTDLIRDCLKLKYPYGPSCLDLFGHRATHC